MLNYFKKNFDEISILALFAKLQFEDSPVLTAEENSILLALTRSTNDLNDFSSISEVQEYLSNYSPEGLQGIANNVKGILHEIEFVKLENTDNDGVYASLFQETNHQGYDIQFFDDDNVLLGEAQLKATDSTSYINDWIEKNDGDIIVTSEIAAKMGLNSSGISNEELTVKTNEFIDKMVDGIDNNSSISDYTPYLSVISISIILYELWKRYQDGYISLNKFKTLSMYATGYKAAKITAITILLSIPVVNVATTIGLLVNLLFSLSNTQKMKPTIVEQDMLKVLTK